MTNAEHERAALRMLAELLEIPPEQRPAALASFTLTDAALERSVRRLLELVDKGDLDVRSSPETLSELREALGLRFELGPGLAPGAMVGSFRIERSLGSGGMGEVWRAQRAFVDFEQTVALKVLRLGLDSPELRSRFLQERRMLAELVHPGIPRLIDGGTCHDGRPYFAMECVDGEALDTWSARNALGVHGIASLFVEICEAVAHAHERGVVHRDLKPANILVDVAGRAHVLDFGIAKIVDSLGEAEAHHTLTHQRLLTPSYASPEQVAGDPVSPSTDVHALGLVLYELLTGATPFGRPGASLAEIQWTVRTLTPAAPSRSLLPRLQNERALVRGDLETILGMALRKEPERRYVSAGYLAEDLRRYLTGARVEARGESVVYRATRFIRRNRALVAGVSATALALLAGVVASQVQYRRARIASTEAARLAYVATLDAVEGVMRSGNTGGLRDQLLALPAESRGWEWSHFFHRITTFEGRFDFASPHERAKAGVAFGGAGGEWIALFDEPDVMICRDGVELGRCHVGAWCALTRWDGSGRVLVADESRQLLLLSVASDGSVIESPLGSIAAARDVVALSLATSPDGARGAATLSSGEVVFFDGTGVELARFAAHEASELGGSIAWSDVGDLVATGGWDETVQLFDGRELRQVGTLSGHAMGVNHVAFDPDGARLASTSFDRNLIVWDLASRSPIVRRRYDWILGCVAFSGDGQLLVSDTSCAVRLVDPSTCDELAMFLGARSTVWEFVVSPDRERFAAAELAHGATIFEIADRAIPSVRVCEFARGLALSPDGRRVLTGGPDERARVFELPRLSGGAELGLRGGYVLDVAWSPDGALLGTAHFTSGFALWRAADSALLRRFAIPDDELAVGVTVNAATNQLHGVSYCVAEHRVTVWTWSLDESQAPSMFTFTGRDHGDHRFENARLVPDRAGAPAALMMDGEAWGFRGSDPPIELVMPDGLSAVAVALGLEDDELLVVTANLLCAFDARSGRLLRQHSLPTNRVSALSVHRALRRIAVGGEGKIDIYDGDRVTRVASLHGHGEIVHRVLWSTDGATLVSLGFEGDLKVWRTR